MNLTGLSIRCRSVLTAAAVVGFMLQRWAQEQFGECQFGDLRRTKRLMKAAQQAAARPDGSTPDQSES